MESKTRQITGRQNILRQRYLFIYFFAQTYLPQSVNENARFGSAGGLLEM